MDHDERDRTTGAFAYEKRPSLIIGFGLMFFFIVPGLVYFILAGKRDELTVTCSPSGAGQQVQIVPNGRRGKLIGRDIRRQRHSNGTTVNFPRGRLGSTSRSNTTQSK